MLKFMQKALPWLYGMAIILAIYVVFFMPAGTGSGPVDSNNPSSQTGQEAPGTFNLYSYLNKITSAKGKVVFDCTFNLENGDELKVSSTQNFETKGANSAITGSTSYALNSDTAVFDDYTYIKEGMRYVKSPTGYLKSENTLLDAGNLNLGKIEEVLDRDGDVVLEDGVSCYKYIGSMMYGDMSNNFRAFIRAQNVNISDIQNLPLDITVFVTESYVPYKMVLEFTDAKCMVKCSGLANKSGTASGRFVISFSGFNGVDKINYPADMSNAMDGTYVLTDKVNRYLVKTGH